MEMSSIDCNKLLENLSLSMHGTVVMCKEMENDTHQTHTH